MTSKELRQKYIDFFKSKGHAEIPSASLIPENDPSVLFTTAGMHPLVPFLIGESHPAGRRLVDYQKCVRTGDIDEVGNQWHLTFFEMLGNWSLGEYFKDEAIEWSFEFLTSPNWLGIDQEKLAVSVFAGDEDASFDKEAYNLWLKIGIPKERIYKYGKDENWWGPAGQTGPCGPDTEMFYITDKPACGSNCQPSCGCGKYIEIWNDVFMQYNKTEKGKYELLEQKNVDTGMGLERTVAALNGYQDNFQELLKPLVEKTEELSGKQYGKDKEVTQSMRVIADHLRAATFIMGDDLGIKPSNVDQGYVVRKLLRRAIRHGRMLGINKNFTHLVSQIVIQTMSDVYAELKKNEDFILANMKFEEEKFSQTLQQGLKIFHKHRQKIASEVLPGEVAFDLYQTYGFPIELTQELAKEQGLKVDKATFDKAFEEHQEKSRTAAAGKFKGGLGEHTEITKKYHTATHLLHAALRSVLGEYVEQRGSNINEKRLRFDFSYSDKMSPEEIVQVENMVNKNITRDLPVYAQEMSLAEAKQKRAMGLFEHKYGDKVKVYTIGKGDQGVSCEICGGPHVSRTGELGHFKIIKEESSSAGIRRIKAVLE